MPKEEIAQITQDNQIGKELVRLRSETLILVIVIFSALGLVLSYYLFNNPLRSPFKNISYEKVDENRIGITWETRVPMKTKVEYGTSKLYLNDTEYQKIYDTKHIIFVNGLLPKKDHYFRLIAEDMKGQKYISPFYLASK